jgi:hypothetical protein
LAATPGAAGAMRLEPPAGSSAWRRASASDRGAPVTFSVGPADLAAGVSVFDIVGASPRGAVGASLD